MSAKSFFQRSPMGPRLFRRFAFSERRACFLEVWTTTCIVTNFGQQTASKCSVLVNPSNPGLSGTSNFPYFPRGGPVPEKPTSMHKDWQPLGYVSQWGGMEVGNGMLFSVSVVDGLVHLHGGWKLQMECKWHRFQSSKQEPCPVGSSILTSAGNGALSESYSHVIHTTPPFFNQIDLQYNQQVLCDQLGKCYHSAVELACTNYQSLANGNEELRLACPLLGSGCRGFPMELAMHVAVTATQKAVQVSDRPLVLVFGLLEEAHAKEMVEIVEQKLK